MANWEQIEKEVVYLTSRSSGPGGQHVNKLETKVQVRFDLFKSLALNQQEKLMILKKLQSRINKNGEILIVSQKSRNQRKNKANALKKLMQMLQSALKPKKIRKKTIVPAKQKEKRLSNKKIRSGIKTMRKNPFY